MGKPQCQGRAGKGHRVFPQPQRSCSPCSGCPAHPGMAGSTPGCCCWSSPSLEMFGCCCPRNNHQHGNDPTVLENSGKRGKEGKKAAGQAQSCCSQLRASPELEFKVPVIPPQVLQVSKGHHSQSCKFPAVCWQSLKLDLVCHHHYHRL